MTPLQAGWAWQSICVESGRLQTQPEPLRLAPAHGEGEEVAHSGQGAHQQRVVPRHAQHVQGQQEAEDGRAQVQDTQPDKPPPRLQQANSFEQCLQSCLQDRRCEPPTHIPGYLAVPGQASASMVLWEGLSEFTTLPPSSSPSLASWLHDMLPDSTRVIYVLTKRSQCTLQS